MIKNILIVMSVVVSGCGIPWEQDNGKLWWDRNPENEQCKVLSEYYEFCPVCGSCTQVNSCPVDPFDC